MVRIVVRMRPEARIEFPEMEIPLLLDVGAVHASNRPGSVMPGVGLQTGTHLRPGSRQ